MIWNDEFETLPREVLDALQLKRLKKVIERVRVNVPFYRDRFKKLNIDENNINSISDIRKLPFTTKEDLNNNYPFNMFAVPRYEIVRIHASSGTTGKPTVVGYTKRDISIWSEIIARALYAAGIRKGDIIQNSYAYGLFTGGLGIHYGVEKIGASVVPTSGGNTKKQAIILKDFGVDALTCTPSYSLCLYDAFVELGIDPSELNLRVGILGAEPWCNEMRNEIEDKLKISALDIYGLTEIIGPGVGFECIESKNGMHINEDHFLVELINPNTLEPVSEGEEGELVFTTLTKEGMPLIRYRTRDITRVVGEMCLCGRTTKKIEKIRGRSDDMLIIRGVNVFPSQIEAIISQVEGVLPYYQIVVDRVKNLDTIEILVEVEDELFSDEVRKLQEISKNIEREIKSVIGLSSKVRLVEYKTLKRFEGKSKRVVDKRVPV
ncbi:MAG: phenylacetate--CoA ligase [Deferribacterota bacterium]|nr:phenylacetate--CoA ligase [Deferribacterota bacterium]